MTVPILILLAAVAALLLAKRIRRHPSREEITEKLSRGAVVIDVRTAEEYARAHYPGARNIPVKDISRRWREIGEPSTPIVVYCAAGGRATTAQRVLTRAGFEDVLNAGSLSRMPRPPA